jgi:hypothetical protein
LCLTGVDRALSTPPTNADFRVAGSGQLPDTGVGG